MTKFYKLVRIFLFFSSQHSPCGIIIVVAVVVVVVVCVIVVVFIIDALTKQTICLNNINTISFLPMLHDWCNKCRGMCYLVCGMVHIKEPLLLIGNSSPCGVSGFPLSLSE